MHHSIKIPLGCFSLIIFYCSSFFLNQFLAVIFLCFPVFSCFPSLFLSFSIYIFFLRGNRQVFLIDCKHFPFFQQTSPPLPVGSIEAACIYLHMCIFAPITPHTANCASQEHTTSDILPGCLALGGCQPQFCTSLPAQFDVV